MALWDLLAQWGLWVPLLLLDRSGRLLQMGLRCLVDRSGRLHLLAQLPSIRGQWGRSVLENLSDL